MNGNIRIDCHLKYHLNIASFSFIFLVSLQNIFLCIPFYTLIHSFSIIKKYCIHRISFFFYYSYHNTYHIVCSVSWYISYYNLTVSLQVYLTGWHAIKINQFHSCFKIRIQASSNKIWLQSMKFIFWLIKMYLMKTQFLTNQIALREWWISELFFFFLLFFFIFFFIFIFFKDILYIIQDLYILWVSVLWTMWLNSPFYNKVNVYLPMWLFM